MFWVLAIVLTGLVIVALAQPLFRPAPAMDCQDRKADALKAALAEIEADRAAGLINDAEAEEAIVEAQRAALARAAQHTEDKPSKKLRFAAVTFLAASPLFVALTYFVAGTPSALNPEEIIAEAPLSPQEAIAAMAPEDREAAIRSMVEGLAARLEENPEDVAGWRMLARSQGVLGQLEESAAAYQEIFKRDAGTRDDFRAAALTLVRIHGEQGDEDGQLISILETTLERFPGDPLALYQLGVAKRAAGEPEEALALWRELLAAMPEDAPVRPNLVSLIAEAEAEIAADG